jgi:hypothetical protein
MLKSELLEYVELLLTLIVMVTDLKVLPVSFRV